MINSINVGFIEFGRVKAIPSDDYCIVTTEYRGTVICHNNQGGIPGRTSAGRLNMTPQLGLVNTIAAGSSIVFIRDSQNPSSLKYDKTSMWMRGIDWEQVKSCVPWNVRYKVIGYNHCLKGSPRPTMRPTEILEADLIAIVGHPQISGMNSRYTAKIGEVEITSDILWEKRKRNQWIRCQNPCVTRIEAK